MQETMVSLGYWWVPFLVLLLPSSLLFWHGRKELSGEKMGATHL